MTNALIIHISTNCIEDIQIKNFSSLVRETVGRGVNLKNCRIGQQNLCTAPLYGGSISLNDCQTSDLHQITDLRLNGLEVTNQKFDAGFTKSLQVRGILRLSECDHRASCVVAGVTKTTWLYYDNCDESVLDYSVDSRVESVSISSVVANPIRLPSSYRVTAQRVRLEHVIVQYPVCPAIAEAQAIFIIGMPLSEAHRLAAETKGKVFWGRKRNRIK